MNKNLLRKVLFFIITVAMFLGISSTVYARKKVLNITITEKDGKRTYGASNSSVGNVGNKDFNTAKMPMKFGISYDEIVIDYDAEYMSYPFFFQMVKDDGFAIAKYIIDVNYTEKKIIFTKLGATNDPAEYKVTPGSRNIGASYLQAGAVYEDNFPDMGFTYPQYKIVASESTIDTGGDDDEVYSVYNLVNEPELGNGYLNAVGSIASATAATYPSVYVFCATGTTKLNAYAYSDGQIHDQVDVRTRINNAITIINLVKATSAGGGIFKTYYGSFPSIHKNSPVTITYAFYGSTSEQLNNVEAGTAEKILSKIFYALGSTFMSVVQAIFGTDLSIDTIIFNEYNPVVVDYFGTNGNRGLYLPLIQSAVNGWFRAFQVWTELILIIILIAMGIRAALLSGTGKQQKIYNMFVGWIVALVLLFFGPFGMKYAIVLNDSLVKTLKNFKEYSIISVYNFDFIQVADAADEEFNDGEDSRGSFLEYLMGLKEKTEESKMEAEEEIKAVRTELSMMLNDFQALNRILEYQGKVLVITSPTGEDCLLDMAKVKIEAAIEAGHSSGDAYRGVVGTVSIKSREEVFPGSEPAARTPWEELMRIISSWTVSSWVRDLIYGTVTGAFAPRVEAVLQKYAEKYSRLYELKQTLDKINKALDVVDKNLDLMGTMESRINETKRIVYVVIWFILIYQLLLLTFLYYKRALTLAVLIAIFPLTVMFYALEKLMGIDRPQAIRTWTMEYIVNVFIQSVHALLYLALIETGLRIFEQDSDNWIFFVLSVMALFPAEAIVKNILGMKSSTVKDLGKSAKSGLAYAAAAGAILKTRGKYSDMDKKAANRQATVDKHRNTRDKLRNLGGSGRDVLTRWWNNNSDEANERVRQRQEKRAEKKEKRDSKRQANDEFRKKMYEMREDLQLVRNAAAKVDAITTGLSMGGSAPDMLAGASIAGIAAGSTRNIKTNTSDNKKQSGNNSSNSNQTASQGTANQTNGQDGANQNANGQGTNQNGAQDPGNRAAETARAAAAAAEAATQVDYGNGRETPTYREARRASATQEAFRESLNARVGDIRSSTNYRTSTNELGDFNFDDDRNDDEY